MTIIKELFFKLPDFLELIIILIVISSAVFIALLLTFLLTRLMFKIRWEDNSQTKWIRIRNKGNVTSLFRFRAEAEKKRYLVFHFLQDGKRLPQMDVEKIEIEEVRQPVKKTQGSAQTQESQMEMVSLQEGKKGKKDKKDKKKKFEGAKKAQDGAKGAVNKGRQAAGLMGTLGSLIPGEAGNALKSQSTALQASTQNAGYAISLPDQKLAEVKSVKAQSSNIVPGKKGGGAAATKSGLPKDTDLGPQPEGYQTQGHTLQEAEEEIREIRRVIKKKYTISPPVPPGKDLEIRLEIRPRNYYRTRDYDYCLAVDQMVLDGNEYKLHKEDMKDQTASIEGFSFVFRTISFLLSLIITGINLSWLVFFIRWITINFT